MPFVWCIGSIIGPALGGALADPVRQYPGWFAPGGFLEEYPYALPNLVSAGVLVIGCLVGVLFLEETHAQLKYKRDYGLEAGQKIIDIFTFRKWRRRLSYASASDVDGRIDATRRLLGGDESPNLDSAYSTFANSEASSSNASLHEAPVVAPAVIPKPVGLSRTYTPQVINLIISYGFVALHTIAFEQLFPVFLSTPESDEPPHNLFKFVGGFGMSTRDIGVILTVQGVMAMLMQFLVFPPLVGKFGALNVYRAVILFYPLSYIIVPYLDFLPVNLRYAGIYSTLVVKILFGCLSYPTNMILLTNSAPSLLVLGSINGMAASVASLCRSVGPTISGMIYAWGLDLGYVGLAWWVNAAICVAGAIHVITIKEPEGNVDDEDIIYDEEVIAHAAVEAQIKSTTAGVSSAEECFNEFDLVQRVVSIQPENEESARNLH